MIDEQLRRHIDAIASPLALDEVTEPGDPSAGRDLEPRRGRSVLAIAASAVVVIGIVGVTVAGSGRSTTETPPPSPATMPPAPPLARDLEGLVFDPPARWDLESAPFVASDRFDVVEMGDGGRAASSATNVADTIEYAGSWLAIGHANEGFEGEAAVWRSPSGRSWERVRNDAFGVSSPPAEPDDAVGYQAVSVAVRDERIVMVGTGRTEPDGPLIVWTSDDAIDWTRHTIDLPDVRRFAAPTGVTVFGDLFVLVGIDNGDPIDGSENRSFLLTSTDGERWSAVTDPSLGAPGVFLSGIEQFGDTLVVYGSTGGHDGTAAAWTANDPTGPWSEVALGVLATDDGRHSAISHATRADGTLLLVGHTSRGAPGWGTDGSSDELTVEGQSDVAAWWTDDGDNFVRADLSAVNSSERLDLVTAVGANDRAALITTTSVNTWGVTTRLIEWMPTSARQVGAELVALSHVTTITAISGDSLLNDGLLLTAVEGVDRLPIDSRPELLERSGQSTTLWFVPAR